MNVINHKTNEGNRNERTEHTDEGNAATYTKIRDQNALENQENTSILDGIDLATRLKLMQQQIMEGISEQINKTNIRFDERDPSQIKFIRNLTSRAKNLPSLWANFQKSRRKIQRT